MRSSTLKIVAALAALTLATCVWAADGFLAPGHGHGPFHGPGHGPDFVAHLTKALGLSEDQTSQVSAIVSRYMAGTLGQTMQGMRDAHSRLHAEVIDATTTDAQVQAAASALSALEAQAAVEHHHMAVEISGVLTPEQRQKAAQLRQNMKEMRWGPSPDDDAGE